VVVGTKAMLPSTSFFWPGTRTFSTTSGTTTSLVRTPSQQADAFFLVTASSRVTVSPTRSPL
jgi:hypothetical protein